jgi:hypothetical protein
MKMDENTATTVKSLPPDPVESQENKSSKLTSCQKRPEIQGADFIKLVNDPTEPADSRRS